MPINPVFLLAGLSVLTTACAARSATLQEPIAWTLHADEAQLAKGRVQLGLTARWDERSRSNQSREHDLASLQGLPASALADGASREVAFAYIRPAGRLDCSGVVKARVGAGTCRFTGDARFAEALRARGIGQPDSAQLYQLTIAGTDLAVLDALARHGYPQPDVGDLVKLGIFDVTPAYVDQLAASGYRLGAVEDLVQFKIFRITPEFISELAAIGPSFRKLPAKKLVEYRIHNVSARTVRELAELGYHDLERDAVTRFAIFKVTPDFIRELRELGYSGLTPEQLVNLRIHGVTPDYIRGFARAGIARPGIEQLTRMRMAGYDPARRSGER